MADQESAPGSTQLEIQIEGDISNIPKPTTPSNARTCGVCKVQPAKYKCTKCELPYCSIACNQEHKASHPVLPSPPAPEIRDTVMETTPTNRSSLVAPRPGTQAAAGRSHLLAPLIDSPDLKQLFTLYPSLREHLQDIYAASQPPADDDYSTNDGRGRYTNVRDKPFWTKEQGTRDGVDALKAAKTRPGMDGEGVRRFAQLVVSVISPENVVNGNLDGPTAIQKQAQDENAMMITQLLNGELGIS